MHSRAMLQISCPLLPKIGSVTLGFNNLVPNCLKLFTWNKCSKLERTEFAHRLDKATEQDFETSLDIRHPDIQEALG